MLPEQFKSRMICLLGNEEAERLFYALSEEEETKAIRINSFKENKENLLKGISRKVEEIPYCENGFYIDDFVGIGNTPCHHAGKIYVQDPGAMSAVEAVPIKAGFKILDMCAAPGGKSTQAIAKAGESGFIIANEYVPKRAKLLVQNFERLGIKNSIVTSLDTKEFKNMFKSYFDLVILDAPCSGEGMFRKSEAALSEWSIDNVILCQKRQREIIENAVPLVKDGGYLLYSTCTFSKEENEDIVASLLQEHSEFSLVYVNDTLQKHTKSGISSDVLKEDDAKKCRRFYPHIAKGEGQFFALFKKTDEGALPKILFKDSAVELRRDEAEAVKDFFKKNLFKYDDLTVKRVGENIVVFTTYHPVPKASVFMSGTLLGEIKKNILFPSHNFFSSFGERFIRQINLTKSDKRSEEYLRGNEIENTEAIDGGWCAVLYEGSPLGGGKAVEQRIKNHYPKGLRLLGNYSKL